jgi:hypothetical protein
VAAEWARWPWTCVKSSVGLLVVVRLADEPGPVQLEEALAACSVADAAETCSTAGGTRRGPAGGARSLNVARPAEGPRGACAWGQAEEE